MRYIYQLNLKDLIALVFLGSALIFSSCSNSDFGKSKNTNSTSYKYEYVGKEQNSAYVISSNEIGVFVGGKNLLNIVDNKQRSLGFKVPDIKPKTYTTTMINARSTDSTASQNNTSSIYIIKKQPDMKLIIAGNFGYINGTKRNSIARLNQDGSLDKNFMENLEGVNGEIYDLEILDNGQILIAGYFTKVNGHNITALARLNSNGTLDQTFNISIENGVVQDILLLKNKMIISGVFSTVNGVQANGLVLLNSKNEVVESFIKNIGQFEGIAYKTLKLSDDKLLVIGNFKKNENQSLMILDQNGHQENNFISDKINGYIFDAIKLDNGEIFIGGDFSIENQDISGLAIIDKEGKIRKSIKNVGSVYSISNGSEKNEIIISGDLDNNISNILKVTVE